MKTYLRFLIIFCFFSLSSFGQTLVINEVSNGPSGDSNEFIELIVNCDGNPGCVMDITGWKVDDNDGTTGPCGSSFGIAQGHLEFPDIPEYQCVPCGALITIYTAGGGDPLDADGDLIYNLGIGDMTGDPNYPCEAACGDYDGTSGNCSGGNIASAFGLNNTNDLAQVLDPSGTVVHSVGWGIGNFGQINFTGNGSGQAYQLTDGSYANQGSWQQVNAGTSESPGAYNTTGNADYAATMLMDFEVISQTELADCRCVDVVFQDNACGSAFEWEWTFGDPISGSDNSLTYNSGAVTVPMHTYCLDNNQVPGTYDYNVDLTVYYGDNNTCPVTVTNTVSITFPDSPNPPVEGTPVPPICGSVGTPVGLDFEATAVGNDVNWYFDEDGTMPVPGGQLSESVSLVVTPGDLNCPSLPCQVCLYAASFDGSCESVSKIEVCRDIAGPIQIDADIENDICTSINNVDLTANVLPPTDPTLVEFCYSPNPSLIVPYSVGTGYFFDIASAGEGTYVIEYSLVDALSNCTDACGGTFTITVVEDQAASIDLPVGPFCETDDPVFLTGTPSGGTWFGPGIVGTPNTTGEFDPSSPAIPASGIANITYEVVSSCGTTTDMVNITIDSETSFNLNNSQGNPCNANTGTTIDFELLILAAPTPNGSWDDGGSGADFTNLNAVDFTGVIANTYTFTFTPDGDCVASSTVNITVNDCACPDVSVISDPSDICNDETLNATLSISNPDNEIGSWSVSSGGGTINNSTGIYNPQGTTGAVELTFELIGAVPAGCDDTFTLNFNVNSNQATGTPSSTDVCNSGSGATTVILADLLTGESSGGTWTETSATPSAAGFNAAAGTFNPSGENANTYTFEYSFSDSCADSPSTVTVNVNTAPAFNIIVPVPAEVCNSASAPDGGVFDLYTLIDATPADGDWDIDAPTPGVIEGGNDGQFSFVGASAGLVSFTFTPNAPPPPCTSNPINLSINVLDCTCPFITDVSPDNATVCSGGTINLSATLTTTTNLASVEWLDNNGTVIANTNDFTATVPTNTNNCFPQTFIYTFNMYCTNDPSVIEGTENVIVTVLPEPTATITLSADGCTATATPDCADFSIVGSTEQSTTTNGDMSQVVFDVQHNSDVSCVGQAVGNFNCNSATCPTVQNASLSQNICAGNGADLSDIITGFLIINDDNGTAGALEWFTGVVGGDPFTGTPYSSSITFNNPNCDVEVIEIFAFLQCDLNGDGFVFGSPDDSYISAGSIMVNVYPSFNSTHLSEVQGIGNADGSCTEPQLNTTCANYLIVPDQTPTITNGTSGNWTFDVTYNDGSGFMTCFDQSISVSYNCPDVNCPTITNSADETLDFCENGIPNFATIESTITWDDPNNQVPATDFLNWYDDGNLTNIIDISTYEATYSGNGCDPQTINLFAGLICDADPNPILAGNILITLYPPFDASTLTETEGDCNTPPTLVSSCANYDISEGTNPYPISQGDSGSMTFTITYNDGNGCNFSETQDVDYNCPITDCPQITNVTNDAFLCSGQSIDLVGMATNTNLASVEWLDGIGTQISTTNEVEVTENATSCDPTVVTYTFNVYCTDDPSVVSSSETVTVTYYPIPTQGDFSFTVDATGCSVEATSNCPNYDITSTNPATNNVDGAWTAQFTVQNSDAVNNGANCIFTISEDATCVLPPNCTADACLTPFNAAFCADEGPIDLNNQICGDTGGEWSINPNVSTLIFGGELEIADMSGNYTITYTILGANGCPNVSDDITITINPLPGVDIVTLQNPLINSDCVVGETMIDLDTMVVAGSEGGDWTLQETQFSANFNGNNNVFTAVGIPSSTTQINFNYTLTSPQGCEETAILTITLADCNVDCEDFDLIDFADDFCETEGTINLTTQIPGNVSGNGDWVLLPANTPIPNGQLDISNITNGNDNVTVQVSYTVEEAPCPPTSDDMTFIVYESLDASIVGLPNSLCNDATLDITTIDLDDFSIVDGGDWTASAGSIDADNVLDVDGAVGNQVVLTYSFQNNGNCIGDSQTEIIPFACNDPCADPILVNFDAPLEQLVNTADCPVGSSTIDLDDLNATPAGGTWELDALSSQFAANFDATTNVFDASGVPNLTSVFFVYSVNVNGCDGSGNLVLSVEDCPVNCAEVNFLPIPNFCATTSTINLFDYLDSNTPITGTFAENGAIVNNPTNYNISAVNGDSEVVEVVYIFDDGVCPVSNDTASFTIFAAPNATIFNVPPILCNDSTLGTTTLDLDNLSQSDGGVWTTSGGIIDANNILNVEGVVTNTITLTYTQPANGECPSVDDNVVIGISCNVTCTTPVLLDNIGDGFCSNEDPVNLTVYLVTGSGGQWLIDPPIVGIGNVIDDPENFDVGLLSEGVYDIIYFNAATVDCPEESDTAILEIFEPFNEAWETTGLALCNDAAAGITMVDLDTLLVSDGINNGTWTAFDQNLNSLTSFIGAGNVLNTDGLDASVTEIRIRYFVANGGCTNTIETTITIIDCEVCENIIQINPFNSPICSDGGLIDLNSLVVTPLGGNWSTTAGNGNIDNDENFNPSNVSSGTYNFTYTYSAPGCPDLEATESLIIEAAPIAELVGNFTLCNADDVGSTTLDLTDLLSINSDTGGTWSSTGGAINGSILDVIGVNEGTVTVTYEVAGILPCSNAISTLNIAVEECVCPNPATLLPPPICSNQSFDLLSLIASDTGGNWSVDDNSFSLNGNTLVTNNQSGDVTVTYTIPASDNCPEQSSSQILTVIPDIEVDIMASANNIFGGETVDLNAVGGGTDYVWTDDEGNVLGNSTSIQVNPSQTTIYTLVATEDVCDASASVTIFVDSCREPLIPTAFSPNGDGTNDVFRAFGQNIEEYKMSIYNRWGELLFESLDVNIGWDGTFSGEPQEISVYVYMLEYRCFGETDTQMKNGNVTLVR